MRISNPVPDLGAELCADLRWRLAALLFLSAVFVGSSNAANQPSSDEFLPDDSVDVRSAQPGPGLSPEAVVRIQMQALGSNASWGDDAGIEVAFRFASPANQRMTGPLERFVSLLKNPLYEPMLNHDSDSIEYAPSRDREGKAWIPVRLTADDGAQAGYLFILGRQTGDPCECWMTDSVQYIPVGGAKPRGPAI